MTLSQFKKTRLGKYAMREFPGSFKTNEDVERYRQEILELTHNGDYEAVYDFCELEGGYIDTTDVFEFIRG